MNLVCRNCNWETDSKHFGFIQSEEDTKKHGANHLCMICYYGHTDRIRANAIKIKGEIDNAK